MFKRHIFNCVNVQIFLKKNTLAFKQQHCFNMHTSHRGGAMNPYKLHQVPYSIKVNIALMGIRYHKSFNTYI